MSLSLYDIPDLNGNDRNIWLRGVERFQFEVSVIPIVMTRPVYNMPTDFLLWSCTEQGQ
jgi:hypothetical protein